MTTQLLGNGMVEATTAAPAIDVVVPVYNEATGLDASIRRLHEYLTTRVPLSWVITIADNASTDGTLAVALQLAKDLHSVRVLHLPDKGRGRALRAAWTTSASPVVAYMDVDLSTDLDALLPLVAPLLSGHSDVAIGTRLAPGSHVVRGPKREFLSRMYNGLLKATLHSGFSDAQCGFKAARADVAHALMPLVEDEGWFFDTELLVLAERNGLRIHEVPVDWTNDPDSRVDLVTTARADLAGIWRMIRRLATASVGTGDTDLSRRSRQNAEGDLPGQVVRFAFVGAASTVLFMLLFVALAGPVGAVGANVVALAICAVVNTAVHRRYTFAVRGTTARRRHYVAGIVLGLAPLALTLVALAVMAAIGVTSIGVTALVLGAVSALASLARFVLLRSWAFGAAR
jgi:putative flippase GtrA